MERKASQIPRQVRTHPDRSRSPHRELHQWEKGAKPKSVLYPADIQFHRQNTRKSLSTRRSPSSHSASPSKQRVVKSTTTSPLKDQSQIPRTRTSSHSRLGDPDRVVRNTITRMQKWNDAYSPPKFMAGLMPKGGEMETSKVSSTTPKRRDREAWTVTYHSREPLPFDQETEDIGRGDNIEKSHHSKENIRMIERPSRRSHASPTVEKWRRESHDFLKQHAPPSPTVDVPSRERVVETDADGYAIPLVERNSASLTPSGNDQAHASTPSEQASPNEVFFTPMTHPRPSQRER